MLLGNLGEIRAAGPCVEVIATVVPRRRTGFGRGDGRGARRCAAIVVADLHQCRARDAPGAAGRTVAQEFESDCRVDPVAPRRSGQRRVTVEGAAEIDGPVATRRRDDRDGDRVATAQGRQLAMQTGPCAASHRRRAAVP